MKDNVMIAPYLASSLVNLFEPENKSQFKLEKDPNSNKMNEFLINTSKPVTLYSMMLTFRDSNISFKLNGDLLKTMTICNFNATHSNPQDQKLIYEFEEEMNFDIKQKGRKNPRERSIINYLNHKPSWRLEFPQIFYHHILTIYVID